MKLKYLPGNLFFILCCFPAWVKFYFFINNAIQVQNRILKRIINQNKNSQYGRMYSFSKIKTYNDWKSQVPVVNYEDIEKYVTNNFLTTNKIKILEPTSGSSGVQKLIPHTEELRKEFQNGIKVWLFDLFLHNPKLFFYKSYWSISPKTCVDNGLDKNIGFEKDEEYFSKFEQKFLDAIVVRPNLNGDFKINTQNILKQEKYNIGLISIWSPTFLNAVTNNKHIDFKNLQVISCWADSISKIYAHKLQNEYPNAKLQPKGLLATEGITTFPLCDKGCILSYLSHFYEFKDSNNNICSMQNLREDKTYTVILTTSGGLYRYNTHDLIKVNGFYKKLPIIEFIGRDNNVSDFFGEKISEGFVNNVFKNIFQTEPTFAVLGFNKDRYTLYLEGNCDSESLENALRQNYHYKNCIELNQLQPCTVKFIKNGLKKYQDFYEQKGVKSGDIKIKALDNNVYDIFEL